jgi:hypothetical protein
MTTQMTDRAIRSCLAACLLAGLFLGLCVRPTSASPQKETLPERVQPQLEVPRVGSVSSRLEIRVESVDDGPRSYRITVANSSKLAVMAFRYVAYRGSTPFREGVRRGTRNLPLIREGEAYGLLLETGASVARGADSSPGPRIDRLEITSVLWSDGGIDGDARLGIDQKALDAGVERQLRRAIDLLRQATQSPGSRPLPALRAEIAALSDEVGLDDAIAMHASMPAPRVRTELDVRMTMIEGMQKAKTAVLREIEARLGLAPPLTAATDREWLETLVAGLDEWQARVVDPRRQ